MSSKPEKQTHKHKQLQNYASHGKSWKIKYRFLPK